MKRIPIIALLLTLSLSGWAQSSNLTGNVLSDQAEPLAYATVVLLNPKDSTLEFFAISNEQGLFEIKDIKRGEYLMQLAFVGFETQYQNLAIPRNEGSDMGTMIMKPKPIQVGQVNVVGEYIPLQIRNDTLEFNARAFKTRPDANVEELLKKLPGIEVDRAGNVKALGENVSKVFVDGKEFFGNDPKVATKNIPADAIDKVQVFNKKSDESEFTGIDDGTYSKAINLVLDEDKKDAVFGDVTAGYGTDNHYTGGAKVYRFSDKIQLAGLAMQNNINQSGFSFSDYMNFNGGMSNMMAGGSAKIEMSIDNSMPINFGQAVTGLTTSGAAGLNFSYSKVKERRFFISYLGNASKKDLQSTTSTWNYLTDKTFFQDESSNDLSRDTTHRVNMGVRYRIDSTRNIFLDANASLSQSFKGSHSLADSYIEDAAINSLDRSSIESSTRLNTSGSTSYVRLMNKGRSVFKIGLNGNYNKELAELQWTNGTTYYTPFESNLSNQYQNNITDKAKYAGDLSLTQKIGKYLFFIPSINVGNADEWLDRVQGIPAPDATIIDSLSPSFTSNYRWFKPGITLKRNTEKLQLNLILRGELSQFTTGLWNEAPMDRPYFYLTPGLMIDWEIQSGRRLNFVYSSSVITPSTGQLLPIVNNINPLNLFYGNINLKPEYQHRAMGHWILFDQFSFTSFFANVSATYTKDKINWSRTINDQLGQAVTLVNVDDDLVVSGGADFSTPIRKLGIKVNIGINESWNRGINIVNGIENINTNMTHSATLQIDNRKKDKWDVMTGASISLTDANYSLQETLNNLYFNIAWFTDIRFTPNEHWNFQVSADITNYNSRSFNESVSIPLLGAEMSYSFLKNNRGILSIAGYDLLNMNTGLERISELNYLRERRSNTIGRYVLLSFKYRLNKFGEQPGGINIKMNRHR